MKYARTRGLKALAAVLIVAVITLGIPITSSAASSDNFNLAWMTVQSSTLTVPPSVNSQPFTVNLFTWQTNHGTHGFIFVYDPVNDIGIIGNISTISVIGYGYQFQGCGKAFGPLHVDVCYTGTGQTLPNGSLDGFAISLTSGASYSAGGYLPAGSVKSTNTVGVCIRVYHNC